MWDCWHHHYSTLSVRLNDGYIIGCLRDDKLDALTLCLWGIVHLFIKKKIMQFLFNKL